MFIVYGPQSISFANNYSKMHHLIKYSLGKGFKFVLENTKWLKFLILHAWHITGTCTLCVYLREVTIVVICKDQRRIKNTCGIQYTYRNQEVIVVMHLGISVGKRNWLRTIHNGHFQSGIIFVNFWFLRRRFFLSLPSLT
jgi:hypothetical protein